MIFRHIPTDHPEFEMTTEKWNYLITITTGIENIISSTGNVIEFLFKQLICHKTEELSLINL